MSEPTFFSFPPPPHPDATEWPGTPIGAGNCITRTKGRTAIHDKTVDCSPGLHDKLVKSATDFIESRPPRETLFHDVIIHGIRVRAQTNSPHLMDFWRDNWYSVYEWQHITGLNPPAEPQVMVYAFGGVKGEKEAAYYSRATNTIAFFNTSYYGQLKSWVLGAVGRILAEEYGIHSIHGACVEKDGKGVLYIAPTGTGKSTSSYGLVTYPNSRFHSDDWVYVRYTYQTRDGQRVFLTEIEGNQGSHARGYRVYRWVESHQDATDELDARMTAMTLDNQVVHLRLRDLDLTQPIKAYAYTSEKVFYLRTNLVENFPLSAVEILRSKAENVPDIDGPFIEKHRSIIDQMKSTLLDPANLCAESFRRMPADELDTLCGRLIAFDNARSMLDITRVLPAGRVFSNPMEPVHLTEVILLKRNPDDPVVLERLKLDRFMRRLLIGETPEKKREIAYNAYRAVDDKEEIAFIQKIEAEWERRKGEGEECSLYRIFCEDSDVPKTLYEEFELFRVMHQATKCYDLNTNLQKDPTVRNKREAVERTMCIINRTLEREPETTYSLHTYHRLIE